MSRLFLILYILSLQPAFAGLLAPWVGPNIRLGEDPAALPAGDGLNQAEPHVTRSSANPDLILATFQEGRYSLVGGAVSNGYAVSMDGGFSWSRGLNPRLTLVSGGSYYRATDPVAGIANDGTLYLNSLVSVDEAFGLGRLVLQRSFDFGDTWSDPLSIYTGRNFSSINQVFPDKNWMAVNDIGGTATEGRIVVTWTDFRTIRTPGLDIDDYLIMSSYSDNRGQTWSEPVFVTPAESETYSRFQYQGSQPVFLPHGDLAIVYHNFYGSRIEVKYSPDGGQSFPYAADRMHNNYLLYDAPNMRDGSFLPSVDVSSESGDIYLAYTSKDSAFDTYGHIYFVRSRRDSPDIPNNAAPQWNFTQPLKISGVSPERVVCTPAISVSPDGRRVTVFFYDSRHDPGQNAAGDFYCVQSVDGGSTWSTPFRLSDQTFPLNRATQTNRGYMLGDYFGIAAPMGADQAAVAVWVGTPLETADPWSARIADTGMDVMDSWMQANVSYRQRTGPGFGPFSDGDRDGIPLLLEYITGQSPMMPETRTQFGDSISVNRLHPGTDPDLALEVAAGTGLWPGEWEPSTATAQSNPVGEGYWDKMTWSGSGSVEQIRFLVDGDQPWHLLKNGSPSQWVLDLGNNRVWSPWLGYLETTHAPWLFHSRLGWVYDLRGALFHPGMNVYLMPMPQHYPWIYTSRESFIYLHDRLPWVYDSLTGGWQRVDQSSG